MFTINDDMTAVFAKTKSGIPVEFFMGEGSDCVEIYVDGHVYPFYLAKDLFINTDKGVICLYAMMLDAEKFSFDCKKEAIDEMTIDEQKNHLNPFGY